MSHASEIKTRRRRRRELLASADIARAPRSDNPDGPWLERELESDRRGERALVWKALIAAVFVALLVVVREAFFV